MNPSFRHKLASLITTLIFGYILYRVFERMIFVVWVQIPWWGLIIVAVLLFLAIDYLVNRIIAPK
ncbi:MAG: hypothetical protein KIH69_016240 [Anaerolineae bacterium]|nr:hypothetical protein [Anaerolineae bacterium]